MWNRKVWHSTTSLTTAARSGFARPAATNSGLDRSAGCAEVTDVTAANQEIGVPRKAKSRLGWR
jgi:hypothetical protein